MEILSFSGLDAAIVGYTQDNGRLVYDADKVIELLSQIMGVSLEEAEEFAYTNTFSAYLGEGTPLVIHLSTPEAALENATVLNKD
jgi:hypothetical protein